MAAQRSGSHPQAGSSDRHGVPASSIRIEGSIAAGALRAGEGTPAIVFFIARGPDRTGAGKVPLADLARLCRTILSAKQLERVLEAGHGRYWYLRSDAVFLIGQKQLLQRFSGELNFAMGTTVALSNLGSRSCRNAALLADRLEMPLANQTLKDITGVDRKSIGRWMRDSVIRARILSSLPTWAWSTDGHPHARLPNRWSIPSPTDRSSAHLRRAAQPLVNAVGNNRRRYFPAYKALSALLKRMSKRYGHTDARRRFCVQAVVFVGGRRRYRQLTTADAWREIMGS